MGHRVTELRFDDRLATVLAMPLDDAAARVAAWRQLVDLLAQMPRGDGDPFPPRARALLRDLAGEVPLAIRIETLAALAGRRVHPAVVALVALEGAVLVAPLIGSVRLDDREWLRLLPRLSITARALLRRRRDLSPRVLAGLASFGASDFALPPAGGAIAGGNAPAMREPAGAAPGGAAASSDPRARPDAGEPPASPRPRETLADEREDAARGEDAADGSGAAAAASGDISIADLLVRIADYQRGDAPPPRVPAIEAFRFETGVDGVISWVEDAPRAALIGVPLADAAAGAAADGPDARPFHARAPFRDARLTLAGDAAAAGEWRIAAVPVFDPVGGRFAGYRGTARRPSRHAPPPPAAPGLYGTGLSPDALRQLVHELRTPLNAIVGFGEMIEQQMLGPAAAAYRARARMISGHGQHLLGVVEDLDLAARIDPSRPSPVAGRVLPEGVLRRLWERHGAVAAAQGASLDPVVATEGVVVLADPVMAERTIGHLLAVATGFAGPGDVIGARLTHEKDAAALRVTRPAALAAQCEALLLTPGFAPDGAFPEAPPLGPGFALRLVRDLAVAIGGAFAVEATCFVLRLPVATTSGGEPR